MAAMFDITVEDASTAEQALIILANGSILSKGDTVIVSITDTEGNKTVGVQEEDVYGDD